MFRRLLPGIRKFRDPYSKPTCKYAGCPSNYGVEPSMITKVCVTVGAIGSLYGYLYYIMQERNYRRAANRVLMKNRSSAGEEKSTKK